MVSKTQQLFPEKTRCLADWEHYLEFRFLRWWRSGTNRNIRNTQKHGQVQRKSVWFHSLQVIAKDMKDQVLTCDSCDINVSSESASTWPSPVHSLLLLLCDLILCLSAVSAALSLTLSISFRVIFSYLFLVFFSLRLLPDLIHFTAVASMRTHLLCYAVPLPRDQIGHQKQKKTRKT